MDEKAGDFTKRGSTPIDVNAINKATNRGLAGSDKLMGGILGLGIFWTLRGIAGLLGFQIIDEKYKNHEWTIHFIRYRGVSWLMIGIPWLILYFWAYGKDMNKLVMCLLILLCGLPSIVYTIVNERKYKNMLEKE